MSQTLADDSEFVFDQPEESAGAMEPDGSISTEPTQRGGVVGGHSTLPWGPTQNDGIRPASRRRAGCHYANSVRGGGTDTTTNGTTQKRGSPTEGTSGYDGLIGFGSGGPAGPAEGDSWSAPTKQRMVTRGGIGRYRVSYEARSRGVTDGKPIFEGTRARAPGTTGGTHDDKGTLV